MSCTASASGAAAPPCRLDALDEADIDRFFASARDALKTRFGLTDADIDALLRALADRAQPGASGLTRRVFGDLTKCRDVRRNQVAAGAHAAVMAAQVVVIVLLVRAVQSGYGSPADLDDTLTWLSLAGSALLAYRLRHVISLLGKVAWYGIGPNTQVLLALTAVSSALTLLYGALDPGATSSTVVVVLLAALAAMTAWKAWYSARAALQPESTYLTATTAALDRALSGKKIAQMRAFYTKSS